MAGVIGVVVDAVGQDLIEQTRQAADADAKRAGGTHGDQHAEWRLFHPVAAIMAEEREIRDLDA